MQVGPFTLETRLGAGGMGEVWLARHRAGLRVALKFDLHPPEDQRREAFLHEVRLVAGLDHEHCVLVFDAGIVSRKEARPDSPLRENAPWLAMELANGGSVADPHGTPTSWEETLHVFRGLLLGLAHAHARGVVHRDIKPGNLLLAGPRGSRTRTPGSLLEARPVLSDFGIGFSNDVAGYFDETTVGTPRFMAPEQIEARWRDMGPWTDLYQCGVMLWRLVTGEYPFRHKDTMQIYRAHLFEQPPAFLPQFDVPEGLEAVARALLAKEPADRPRFAREALTRLEELGPPVQQLRGGFVPLSEQPTVARGTPIGAPSRVSRSQPTTTNRSTLVGGRAGAEGTGRLGAGLGLWGLRPVPLVGRTEIRAQLWGALDATVRVGRPHVVVLRGPEGTGKSRLAQALAEEADELARARAWRATHAAPADASSGLDGMLRRELRLGGLSVDEGRERLEGLGLPAEPLARWLLGGESPALAERFVLAGQVLAADPVPRVLWLDDAQRSPETLAFAGYCANRVAAPVLLVLTVRDEEVAADPELPPRIARLLAAPRTVAVEVGPLPFEHHREFVRTLLGLDGNLAVELEERTAGNPRFAVDLVDAWVEEGVLVAGRNGLRLANGAEPRLPPDLTAVWAERLDRVLAHRPAGDARALELAAALGRQFTLTEWRAACARARVPLAPELLDDLLAGRFLLTDPGREVVQFAHGLLREEIERRTRAAGRWAAVAGAAADAVASGGAVDPERLGLLLAAAGRGDEAFRHLANAVQYRHGRGDPRTARLLDVLEQLLVDLEAPPEDERHGFLLLLRGTFHRRRGQRSQTEAILVRLQRDAQQFGWRGHLAMALRDLGTLVAEAGEFREALPMLARAEQLLLADDRTENAASCRMNMGDCYLQLGMIDEAERMFESAIGAVDGPNGRVFAATPYASLAKIYHRRGQRDVASAFAVQAIEIASRLGQQHLIAKMENLQGEMARDAGDLEASVGHYLDAVRRHALFQDDSAAYPTLNLGLVQVLLGQFEEARAIVRPLFEERQRRADDPILVAFCASVLLPASATNPDSFEEFDALFTLLCDFLDATRTVDKDVARMCEITASLLADGARASAVRAVANDLKRRLGT